MTTFILHNSSCHFRFGLTDATAIANHFKGVRKERIEAILDSLQALGHNPLVIAWPALQDRAKQSAKTAPTQEGMDF